ncbi:MAG: 3-hydroxyacyl-CoA dehydrogenase family protein [Candidatus Heimdallarchaeota archaeon]|nr:3-hydroxyacyl-CoA dehydrogenase family protein [Candidatus Heimdallarchaeota archaeon]MCK4876531.1 3-hydroxyacyl-CoA dehydrogenase family protein [Candidatus Heimdallarchaeota archaeon]
MTTEITKAAVVGAGTMGSGIAMVLAQAGIEVNLVDTEQKYLDSGEDRIRKFLEGSVKREKMTQENAENIMNHINTMLDLPKAVEGIQIVIEAIVEDELAKKALFEKLDDLCDEGVIFASNTSAISITELASVTNRKGKFVGMHFFNPPTLMKLVEIIKGEQSEEIFIERIKSLCVKLGKIPITSNEAPGFIVNRLLWQFLNEAYRLLESGVAEAKHIDKAIKLGLNHPMGPFELSDYIGLDVLLQIGEYISEQLGDEYAPANLLKLMVEDGKLGKKTGKGFYDY